VSFDRHHDAEDIQPARRPLRPAPGLEVVRGAARPVKTAALRAARDQGIAEQPAENPELRRQGAEHDKQIGSPESRLVMKDARFEALAREIASREETMKVRTEKLEHYVAVRTGPVPQTPSAWETAGRGSRWRGLAFHSQTVHQTSWL